MEMFVRSGMEGMGSRFLVGLADILLVYHILCVGADVGVCVW